MRHLLAILLFAAAQTCSAGALIKGARSGAYSATGTYLPSNYDSTGATYANGAGYTMKCGTTSGVYTKTATTANPATLTLTVTGLTAGTWYCVVVQLDNAGNESNPTFELTKTVP
jgi:hypothetical protein